MQCSRRRHSYSPGLFLVKRTHDGLDAPGRAVMGRRRQVGCAAKAALGGLWRRIAEAAVPASTRQVYCLLLRVLAVLTTPNQTCRRLPPPPPVQAPTSSATSTSTATSISEAPSSSAVFLITLDHDLRRGGITSQHPLSARLSLQSEDWIENVAAARGMEEFSLT